MSKVKMQKSGTTISVAAAAVAEHIALGWSIQSVSNDLANVDITIGAQATHTINVSIQLQDDNGVALAESMSIHAYLSDDSAGLAVTAAAPDGHVAIGTAGGCIHLVTDKAFLFNTNAAGLLDVNVVNSIAGTWYLALVFPNGERVVSDAITFA